MVPRPHGLARHRVSALCHGGVHPYVHAGWVDRELYGFAKRGLVDHVDYHGHVPSV